MSQGVHWVGGKMMEGLPVHQPTGGGWVAIVCEAPDIEADAKGALSRGTAIKEIEILIKQNFPHLINRIWVTVAVACNTNQPPLPGSNPKNAGKATDRQVKACSQFIKHQLGLLKPEVIIPLGSVACQVVIGRKDVLQLTGRSYHVELETGSEPTRVNHIRDGYDVYIGRDYHNRDTGELELADEGWGNPFQIGEHGTREEVIEKFRRYVTSSSQLAPEIRHLRGKRLGCWCKPDQACHGDVLAELADQEGVAPVAVHHVQAYPLWALGYAKGEDRKWAQYLELWRHVISLYESKGGGVTIVDDTTKQEYDLITDPDELLRWIEPVFEKCNSPVFWDTEATGVKPWHKDFRVFLFSFAHAAHEKPLLVPMNYQHFPELRTDSADLVVRKRATRVLEILQAVMESAKIRKVAHNSKFDQNAVRANFGWKVKGFEADTQILEYCIDPNTLGFRGLDDLVRKYLPRQPEYWRALDKFKEGHPTYNYEMMPAEIMLPYAACDTAVLPKLLDIMLRRLTAMVRAEHGGWFVRANVEPAATDTLSVAEYAIRGRRVHHLIACEIEQNGLLPDMELVDKLHAHYTSVEKVVRESLDQNDQLQDFEKNHLFRVMAKSAQDKWAKEIYYNQLEPEAKPRTPLKKVKDRVLDAGRSPKLNWKSVPQVKAFFIDYLEMPIINTTDSGTPSTDAESLEAWSIEGCLPAQLVLDYREFDKFLTSYINPLRTTVAEDRIIYADGYLHPNLNLTGPRTGRFSACVDGDTLIHTHNWLVPIRNLKIGDKVLTHMGRYRSVLDVFIKSYEEMFLVTTRCGNQIICTAGHRFYTPDEQWVALCDLGVGGSLVSIRGYNVGVEQWGQTKQANGVTVPKYRAKYEIIPGAEKFSGSELNRLKDSIVRIESVGVREVWDCTIEEDHSYVSHGLTSHNSSPNVQAFPRDGMVKRLYPSRYTTDTTRGWIVQRDYSGLEVRVLALMSRDETLLEAFKTGKDPHFRTQEYFFKDKADKHNKTQRSVCKQCLFGRIYGQGDHGLYALLRKNRVMSPTTGQPITIEECQVFNLAIDELYPGVAEWVALAHSQATQKCWTCSPFGFTIPLPTLGFYERYKKEKFIRGSQLASQVGQALRQAQNYPIQSCASDITSFSAYQIMRELKKRKLRSCLILIVHDAIYVDCPEEEVLEVAAIMKDAMDNLPSWIGQILPGYNADWIDIPIIGEQETGINAKDALPAVVEPSFAHGVTDMQFGVPSFKEGDARVDLIDRIFGKDQKTVGWGDRAAIREWLDSCRLVFK